MEGKASSVGQIPGKSDHEGVSCLCAVWAKQTGGRGDAMATRRPLVALGRCLQVE